MQSPSLVSVDMMSAGPPAGASTAKTGQDGIFASHLAAASQGQATTAPQAKTLNKQESTSSPAGQITNAGEETTAQPTEALNTKETNSTTPPQATSDDTAAQLISVLNTKETGIASTAPAPAASDDVAAQLTKLLNTIETGIANPPPAPGDKTKKGETLDHPISDATPNSSAGAATAGIIPLNWSSGDLGFIANQNSAKTLNSESPVSRMLDAITSTANGTKGTPQTDGATASVKAEATVIGKNDTAGQTFTIAAEQPLLPTNPPIAAPAATGVLTPSTASVSDKNGAAQMGNTSSQPQITVSFAPDATPATTAAGMTEKTTTKATPSITAQTQSAATQAAAQQEPTPQGADQIVQNKYGQIITIYQSIPSEAMAATTAADNKPLTTGTNNQNMDANNIHAQLPNDTPKALEKESSSQQQDTAKDNQQKGANFAKTLTNVQPQPEQLAPQTSHLMVGTENQSLVGPHQQISTPLVSSAPLAESSSLRLPSGLTVPGETVVDQMISHFSVNNRLESGTVNLKLNPQELGELRMEIKITQDNIKAHIVAQTPQAQEMISQHLPRLREALEQQGLHLQQIEVTIAANDNPGREQFQGNPGQQQLNQSRHNSRENQPIFTLDTGEETGEATQLINNLSVLA